MATATRTEALPAPLRLEHLVVGTGPQPVVDDLDLLLEPGSVLGIVGASGSGKSTLLAVIAGERGPDGGRVSQGGTPIDPVRVGVATQQHELLGGLTAAENVAARVLAQRPLEAGDWDAITALLARLGLPESSWHNLLEQLSGGQQQRVAVARALVGAPPLVCMDDPTSELDEASAALVWAEVAAVAEAGSVVVLALPDGTPAVPFDAEIRTRPRVS